MQLPPAIIFVNADINDTTKHTLITQLYINEIISKQEFDARLSAVPGYNNIIHSNNLRVLVVLSTFQDFLNRDKADVVMFYNQGQITVEFNKLGPTKLSLPIQRLDIWALLRGAGSSFVVILPQAPCKQQSECCGIPIGFSLCGCLPPQSGMGGIVGEELMASDASGVHLPNCDNIYNNPDFINRK